MEVKEFSDRIKMIKQNRTENPVRIPNCWACMDVGIIRIKDKENAEFFYRCTCTKGLKYECLPQVTQDYDIGSIASANFKDWYGKNKDNKVAQQQLRDLGIA